MREEKVTYKIIPNSSDVHEAIQDHLQLHKKSGVCTYEVFQVAEDTVDFFAW
jgi:hypothetical protein